MLLTRIILLLNIAVLLLVSYQLFIYHTHENPTERKSGNEKTNTTILFMVTSHAQEFRGRQVMRETYLSVPHDRTAYLFIVGKGNITAELLDEQAVNQDIYFLDSADGYLDLSEKILKGLAAAVEHFDFQYVVKVDTDTFVDVPRFVDYVVEKGANSSSFYGGTPGGFFRIEQERLNYTLRTSNHTKRQPALRIPMYQLGGGYVLSYNLAQYFAENGNLLQVYEPEDLTIGVHLHAIDVSPHIDKGVFLTHNRKMDCKRDYLLNHKVSHLDMYYLHYSTLESGSMCAFMHNDTVRDAVHKRIKEATSETLKSLLSEPSTPYDSSDSYSDSNSEFSSESSEFLSEIGSEFV